MKKLGPTSAATIAGMCIKYAGKLLMIVGMHGHGQLNFVEHEKCAEDVRVLQ